MKNAPCYVCASGRRCLSCPAGAAAEKARAKSAPPVAPLWAILSVGFGGQVKS